MQSLSLDARNERTADSHEQRLAIDAENVHVTYADGTEAVRGVDLSVGAGEFFGFLGPNGAGKTTLIRTLVTLIRPTQGTVAINGYDTADERQAVCESIGYMAQETSIDEELTARENVRFACDLYGVPASERTARIEELLDVVTLRDVADKRAGTFSGGMKKRLDAATALVHHPPVVFLDEPTTGLDPEARAQFWDYLQSINERGTTVFLTTQYLAEIDRLCDRLAVIQDGELVATSSPDALKATVGGDILDVTLADPSSEADRAARVARRSTALDSATIETTDEGLLVTSERAREAASDLFVSLHDAGITVTTLDVRSPTLEDVFLSITGQRPSSPERDTPRVSAPEQGVAR